MRRLLLLAAASIAALSTTAQAQTAVIDFEDHDLSQGDVGPHYRGAFNEGDYQFSDSASWIYSQDFNGPAHSGSFDMLNNYNSYVSLTRVDGGVFNLNSLFLNSWRGFQFDFDLVGYLAGVQIASQTVSTGGDWHQVSPNFVGVDRVLFNTTNAFVADDISVTRVAAAAPGAVPEPASWAMMIAGFGLAGAAMRRRARSAVAFA